MRDAARDERVAGAEAGPDGQVQVDHLLLCLQPVQLLPPLAQLGRLLQHCLLLLAQMGLLLQLFPHLLWHTEPALNLFLELERVPGGGQLPLQLLLTILPPGN